METITSNYEFLIGKKPKGYGLWWFSITAEQTNGTFITKDYQAHGLLNEAKRKAVSRMRLDIPEIKKFIQVEILP